jgi:cell wall-associated NlpC family hydrolase
MALIGIGAGALGKAIGGGLGTGPAFDPYAQQRNRGLIKPFGGRRANAAGRSLAGFGNLAQELVSPIAGANGMGSSIFSPLSGTTGFGAMANNVLGESFAPKPIAFPDFPTRPGFGSMPTGATAGAGITPGGSAVTNAGGQFAALDVHNNEITQAAGKFNVPGNLLKAMINNESSGNWERDGSRVVYLAERNDYILPFVGITKAAADAWGLNWNQMIGNKQAQIDGMATIVSGLAKQYGGVDNAIKVYFGGENALKGNWNDENGLGSNYYYNKAKTVWAALDSAGGSSVNAAHGNEIVGIAQQYLGVAYKWGSLPGANEDPWKTGWDCSAFVNWLDDKYGSNQLPAGSHYQYQNAKDTGQLFTDQSQLQAGDIVFFDTGWQGGGGAEMNRAGHVGMYIGNGKVINALNPSAGTVISDLNGLGTFMGAQHMNWSSGVAGAGIAGSAGGAGGGYDTSKPGWFNAIKYGRAAA